MKTLRALATLAVPLLLVSLSLAQTAPSHAEDNSSIVAARCQYLPAGDLCPSQGNAEQSASPAKTDETVAQIPRRFPGPPRSPRRPPMARPQIGYGPRPMLSAGHVAIGALVGFTVGALVPANGSARTRAGVGLIGGMFGALIGAAIPSYPSYHRMRHRRWPDDDDDDLATRQLSTDPGSNKQGQQPVPAAANVSNPPQIEPESPSTASDY